MLNAYTTCVYVCECNVCLSNSCGICVVSNLLTLSNFQCSSHFVYSASKSYVAIVNNWMPNHPVSIYYVAR